jgi:hypothetical protein
LQKKYPAPNISCSVDEWKAHYELWSLATQTKLCTAEIFLSLDAISPFLGSRSNSNASGEFRKVLYPEISVSLPVAISQDLRRAVILDIAIVLTADDSSGEPTKRPDGLDFRSQIVDLSPKRISGDPTLLNKDPLGFRRGSRTTSKESMGYEDSYDIKFSASGEYFVIIRESCERHSKGLSTVAVRWLMQVFQDSSFATNTGPSYIQQSSMVCWAVPEISLLSPLRGIAFHPTLPRFAFPQVRDGLPQTYIWDLSSPIIAPEFLESFGNPFPIHDPPIVDPVFSDDGSLLYGTESPLVFTGHSTNRKPYSTPLFINVPESVPTSRSLVQNDLPSILQTNPHQSLTSAREAASELAKKPKPAVQRANSLVFDQDEGAVVHVSQLQHMEREGAVVLNSFGMDGKIQFQTLSRLPRELAECVDVALVNSAPGLDQDRVRVILNKSPQKFYTPKDISSSDLPMVVERAKESIPTFITSYHLPVDRAGQSNQRGSHSDWEVVKSDSEMPALLSKFAELTSC